MEDKVDNPSPQSTLQVLPSFEVYTPPVTHPEEVEETIGIPMEVEPLNEIKLEEVGLNCNHNTPLSSREDPSFDKPEPQPQPSLNCPPLDASLGPKELKPPQTTSKDITYNTRKQPKPDKHGHGNRKSAKEAEDCYQWNGRVHRTLLAYPCDKLELVDNSLSKSSLCLAKAFCGTPVEGPNCQECALWRKKLKEVWFIICRENGIYQDLLNTYESSDDDTNIVNAPRESFVVKQDPGVNSSQSPPQINHNCCYECGDSLDDIFCQRCTCKSCGKGAHYGYNCPPQIPIISNLEPCYNQNLNEILQNLQSLQQQCLLGTCQQCGCNEYDGVCFYCTVGNGTPINFSTSYSSNDSPSFANHPPQPQYVPYSCELCGNDAHHGYDCPPQVPFVYNQDPCFDQNFDNNFPLTSPSFPQQYLCCENCGGPHTTFQCQPMSQDFYNSNSFGFDQYQPPQSSDIHPHPQETNKEILQAREDLMEAIQAFLKEYDHIPPNEKCMALLLAEERFLKIKQAMEEEQNQPEVMQELLLKLMDDLQILKGSQQEKKETAAQSFTPYWNFSMIDDEEARDNFLKDVCTFLRKFSRIPFGVTPKPQLSGTSIEKYHSPNPNGEMKAITTPQYGVCLLWTLRFLQNPSPKKVVERETEETTNKEQTNFQGSTAQIPPPVIPISILEPDVPKTLPKTTPIPESDIPKSLPKPNIPYPSRRNDQKVS
ncbi:hypothetical protein Tco_1326766 [Tanacetum coccineum]